MKGTGSVVNVVPALERAERLVHRLISAKQLRNRQSHWMKFIIGFSLLGLLASPSMANQIKQSKASVAYDAYRHRETEPSFGLAKIRRLISKNKEVDQDDGELRALPAKAFNALSVSEKFTYCMVNPELTLQNCAAMLPIIDEEHKIFAYPATPEQRWSDRQESFLKTNRPKVIALLRQAIVNHRHVGCNINALILDQNIGELMPDLIRAYRRDTRDLDLLSTIMVLMKNGKYAPFVAAPLYKKLYGDDGNYQAYLSSTDLTEMKSFNWLWPTLGPRSIKPSFQFRHEN